LSPDELKAYLTQWQVKFKEKELQNGIQFRCHCGEIFNAYTTGTVVCQGKKTALSKAVQNLQKISSEVVDETFAEPISAPERNQGKDRRVFIVYGHDTGARNTLELLLRRMDLEPIVLANLPAGGDTIIEKLEKYLGEHNDVGYACVLLTPDDQGHRANQPTEIKYRARQNVILELGMVLARLGRRRVAIVLKESVERPSDIHGLIYIPFTESVEEVKTNLFRELEEAGYRPSKKGL